MKELSDVKFEQSPLAKLHLVEQALKFTLPEEVDAFWEGTNRFASSKDRNIDIDNLQGLCIYMIGQMKDPGLLIECFLISEFLTKSTKVSTRMLFLNVIMASLDFFLEM